MPFTIGGDYIPPQKPDQSKTQKKPLKIRIEKRKQAFVTIIENLSFEDHELKTTLSELKKKFSCGGTLKDGAIILQGNFEDQVKSYLQKSKN